MNRSVSFMGSLTAAKLLNQSSELSETAIIVNSVILKSYTETVVRVCLPKAYRGADTVVLEPMTCLENQQFGQHGLWFIRQGEPLGAKYVIQRPIQLC